ncbi:MAG: hypothetical protein GWN71_33110, partial [Gammaproteobacteria bacterium]|nr:hypothetical protein [Gemmatimonadota bacterium]NIU78224.1 hypothetical protein [Gammaproteobacteria bacterium]
LTHRLSGLCVRAGERARAVEHLRRALLVDPLREDVNQTLIETLAGLGRGGDALSQYRAYTRLL